jgi:hypothetical protein
MATLKAPSSAADVPELSSSAAKPGFGLTSQHKEDKADRIPNSKERLSAYFTILAAAFGLISDGCKFMSVTAYRSNPADYLPRSKQSNDDGKC